MGKWLIELLRIILTALIVFALTSLALRKQSERLMEYIDDWQRLECVDKQRPEVKIIGD